MDYKMRQALIADKEQIYTLFAESIRPYVEPLWGWDEEFQRGDFEASFLPGQFWVVEVQEKFAGFTQIVKHGDITELCEIHMMPKYRGLGIGSGVIRELLNGTVRTGCFKANTRAKKLYQRLGFQEVGQTATHFLLEYQTQNHISLILEEHP